MIRQIAIGTFVAGLCSGIPLALAQAPLPDGYPDPQCKKPQVNMVMPSTDERHRADVRTSNDSDAVNSYNAKIKRFNGDLTAYNDCMHAYIDKANADVKIVQDQANAELKLITERANSSMKAIQDKIRQAVSDAQSTNTALAQDTAKLRKQ